MTKQLQPSDTSPKAPKQANKNTGYAKLFVLEVRSFLYLF